MILSEDISRVREEADIRAVCRMLGCNVTKKSGRYFYIQCPFHNDWGGDGGSCSITPGKNIFHCFACHESGNIFKLVSQIKGFTSGQGNFSRTVKEVYEMCGMTFPLREYNNDVLDAMKLVEQWINNLEKTEDILIPNEFIKNNYVVPSWNVTKEELENEVVRNHLVWLCDSESVEFPLQLRYVEAAGTFSLSDINEKLVGVIVASPESANFAASRGVARKLRGLELNGKEFNPDSPPLFHVRLAVENPLDWLVLVGMGLPACWGLWQGSTSELPFHSPSLTIPCIIFIVMGDSTEEAENRFLDSVSNKWLPRLLKIKKWNSLLGLNDENREFVKNNVMLRSLPVELFDPPLSV